MKLIVLLLSLSRFLSLTISFTSAERGRRERRLKMKNGPDDTETEVKETVSVA